MAVEEGLDTGGTYRRAEVAIGPDDDLEDLRARLVDLGTTLLVEALQDGLGPVTPQEGEPTYAGKVEPHERELDWTAPAVAVHRQVRVGGAWTTVDGKRLKVHATASRPPARDPRSRPATVRWSWSRCSPRARAGWTQPPGPTALAGSPVSGSPRERSMRTAREVAMDALARIEDEGAYANLVLPEVLSRTGLAERDRHFATELVYGTTRMRRACDLLVDRFLTSEVEPEVRRALRLGAYQLHFLAMAPHAAVGETVSVAPRRAQGLVNAVLRKVATHEVHWSDDATRLSYPDWVVGPPPGRSR